MLRLTPLLIAVIIAVAPAAVDAQRPPPPPGDLTVPAAELSLDEAVALVRERTGGRVVRAGPRQDGDRLFYDVRVVTEDGRVRTYEVDAANGAMR